jgi:hypothetical protein
MKPKPGKLQTTEFGTEDEGYLKQESNANKI